MANRTMQAKTLKLKRQKRAWARPLTIRSGIRPNFDVIKGYKERTKSMKMTDEEVDLMFVRIFKRAPAQQITPAKRAVLNLLIQMKDQTPDFLKFNILDSPHEKVDCYFNSQKTCYYLVHEHHRRGFVRRSCTFASKEAAIKKWHMNNVVWVELKLLTNPAPSS